METLEPKTPKRSRRTSVVHLNPSDGNENIISLKTPLKRNKSRTSVKDPELLQIEEKFVAVKTPKRTRRSSVVETEPVLLEVPELEEANSLSLPKMDPVTPGRSTRTLDVRTPSRNETLTSVQTPRRSCRKSVKPIQEYENIVAQKGLSAKPKRLVIEESITSEEVVDDVASTNVGEVRESKWSAIEIGRISSKRSKRKTKKNKRLQRQNKIDDNEEEGKQKAQQSSVDSHGEEEGETEILSEEKTDAGLDVGEKLDEDKIEDGAEASREELDEGNIEDGAEATGKDIEPVPTNQEDEILSIKAPVTDSQNDEKIPPAFDQPTEKEIPPSEVVPAETETSPPDIEPEDDHKSVESDDSFGEEDMILNGMPITGDDESMPSPVKQWQNHPKMSLQVTPLTEQTGDDSDCIMVSPSESTQSRPSVVSQRASVVTGESKIDANEPIDSPMMPPLVVCSDDENEPNLNGTYNTADKELEGQTISTKDEQCIILDEDEEDQQAKVIEVIMSPEQIKKIVLGIDEKTNENDSKSPAAAAEEENDDQLLFLDTTFDSDERAAVEMNAPSNEATPKSHVTRPSITRLPTPFKSDKAIVPDIFIDQEEEEEAFDIIIKPANEYKLKSSRKRSFSFCGVDRPKKNVTFHSPSNTTVQIYEGDFPKSASKHTPTNITKRRKRSLSVTETDRDLMDYIQRKKPTERTTPQKKTTHQSRIRMPNFSNIHQRHFQQMESITDHIARRAERAKNLINSSTKIKPVSVQKGLPVKNSVLQEQNKDGAKTHIPKPKARQRIDMSGPANKTIAETATTSNPIGLKVHSKSKQENLLSDGWAPLNSKTPTKLNANSTWLFKQNNGNKLPKPRFNFNFNATTVPSCDNTAVTPVPQRKHLPNPKHFFNPTTNVHSTTTTSSSSTSQHAAPKADKLEDRRRRNMEMFKSKTTTRVGENKIEILKGVRTNRRFELQMMCRNRQN